MANLRSEIREKVTELLTGVTAAGARVYPTRTRPVWNGQLPAIAIYTETEEAEVYDEAPRRYKRTLTLAIELYASDKDNCDDVLDALSNQVEALMDGADTLGLEGVNDVVYAGAEMSVVGEGKALTGGAKLTYLVEYFTEAGAVIPDADRLDTVKADWDAVSPGGTTEARDELDFSGTHGSP